MPLNVVCVDAKRGSGSTGARLCGEVEPRSRHNYVIARETASAVRWSHHGLEPCGSTGARLYGEAERGSRYGP
jgi:hypothetical protein